MTETEEEKRERGRGKGGEEGDREGGTEEDNEYIFLWWSWAIELGKGAVDGPHKGLAGESNSTYV